VKKLGLAALKVKKMNDV